MLPKPRPNWVGHPSTLCKIW